jgi:hypothetical protein
MIPQRLEQIGRNVGLLLNGFFDYTYNEHKGPIQILHQIERVRSNSAFECDDFYRMVIESDFRQRGGSFNPFDRALEIVEANTRVWKGTVTGRQIEMATTRRWNKEAFTLGDLVWLAYLCVETGCESGLFELERILNNQVQEDDGVFYHVSEFTGGSEFRALCETYEEVLKRLNSVS